MEIRKVLSWRRRCAVAAGVVTVTASLAVGAGSSRASFPVGEPGKIVFSRFDGSQTDVWYMNPDGSGQLDLTNTASPASESGAIFSPDGRRIAYIQDAEVYVMNADGSVRTNLTNTPGPEEQDVNFSPDGRRIAFARISGPDADIAAVNTDGTGAVPITQTPDTSETGRASPPTGGGSPSTAVTGNAISG